MIMQSNMTMMKHVIINGTVESCMVIYLGMDMEMPQQVGMVGVWYWRKLRDTREASNGGRVRVRIIHGLNISHKELTYLLKNLLVIKTKYYAHAPRGQIGREYHRSSPTTTHKEDNQKILHAPTSLHNGSPYVHATRLTNLNTSISQIHNYSLA